MNRATKPAELPARIGNFSHHGRLLLDHSLANLGKPVTMTTVLSRAGFRTRTRVKAWMPAIEGSARGCVLALLGDEGNFDELVTIPAREFWMGDDSHHDSKPRRRVRLPAYQIAKYPVANPQYALFVTATERT